MRNISVGWIVLIIVAIVLVVGVAMKLYTSRGAELSQAQLLEHIGKESDVCILDVRSAREYNSGHVPGAINISHKEVSARLNELEPYRDKDIVVYCELGVRARMAQKTLTKAGYLHVLHLAGDMAGWRKAGLTMETPETETTE
jgi:rhodanese-related sulfurtransferase